MSQVGRILDQIGWSRQKPDHWFDKRDEKEIEEWKEEEWPRIKKAETDDRTVMFVDEARRDFTSFLRRFGRGRPVEKRRCLRRLSTTITCQR